MARAAAYERLGKYAEALADLEVALRKSPGCINYLLQRSGVHLAAGHGAAALQDAESVLKLLPRCREAGKSRARALLLCGRAEESFAQWQALIAAGLPASTPPEEVIEAVTAGLRCGRAGAERALPMVQCALREFPADRALGEATLTLLSRTGRWQDALALVDASMKALPRREWWLAKRASILAGAGQEAAARAECAQAKATIAALPDHLRNTRAVHHLLLQLSGIECRAGSPPPPAPPSPK